MVLELALGAQTGPLQVERTFTSLSMPRQLLRMHSEEPSCILLGVPRCNARFQELVLYALLCGCTRPGEALLSRIDCRSTPSALSLLLLIFKKLSEVIVQLIAQLHEHV